MLHRERLGEGYCHMLNTMILFAQDAAKPANGDGAGSIFSNPIILLPILFMLFYFVVILPQQRKQRKEQENLMTGLKKNDEVVTAAGIIGIVANIKEGEDEITLKIDDNARIRVLKSSIVRIKKKETPGAAPASPAAAPVDTNIKPAN
ncbi:MAG: preprotein translocase subunit YajC [Gemmataceae bacterium]|nr:preprotein translocase subunit YajC [Gemmataceae bacterium]